MSLGNAAICERNPIRKAHWAAASVLRIDRELGTQLINTRCAVEFFVITTHGIKNYKRTRENITPSFIITILYTK